MSEVRVHAAAGVATMNRLSGFTTNREEREPWSGRVWRPAQLALEPYHPRACTRTSTSRCSTMLEQHSARRTGTAFTDVERTASTATQCDVHGNSIDRCQPRLGMDLRSRCLRRPPSTWEARVMPPGRRWPARARPAASTWSSIVSASALSIEPRRRPAAAGGTLVLCGRFRPPRDRVVADLGARRAHRARRRFVRPRAGRQANLRHHQGVLSDSTFPSTCRDAIDSARRSTTPRCRSPRRFGRRCGEGGLRGAGGNQPPSGRGSHRRPAA